MFDVYLLNNPGDIMVMKGKEKSTKLLRVNVDNWSCDMRCEDCYRFFECPYPRRPERYQKRMEAIAKNLKNIKRKVGENVKLEISENVK